MSVAISESEQDIVLDLSENLPLLSAQAGLYILALKKEGNCAYNMSRAYRIEGDIDLQRIQEAIRQLINRHDALRLGFFEKEGVPFQKVVDEVLNLPLIVKKSPFIFEQADIASYLSKENQTPFNLSCPPLIRFLLIQFEDQKSLLIFTGHHLIGDKLSCDILIKEFNACYAQKDLLPALSFQDYIRAYQGPSPESLQYWKTHLQDCPTVLELPHDKTRPAERRFSGNSFQVCLPKSTESKILNICHTHRVTPFMVFCAAYAWFLKNLSCSNDLIIGTPIANRTHVQSSELVGFLTDMIPLRLTFEDTQTFMDIVKGVRREIIQGLSYQPASFYSILKQTQVRPDTSYNPLLQVYFLCENDGRPNLEIPGILCNEILVNPQTSKCDLLLDIIKMPEGYVAVFEYDSDLFNLESVQWFAKIYQRILSQILEQPEIPLKELLLYCEKDKDFFYLYPRPIIETRTLHKEFEQIVKKFPDQIAVKCDNQSITYRELDQKSSHIASALPKNELIGIYMDPSIELIIGILGILKAGSAYVPLDPKAPEDRLHYILSHSKAKAIITHQKTLTGDFKTLSITELLENQEIVSCDNSSDSLAYVIYTSGTTGRPKGVAVTHHNVYRLFLATQPQFQFSPKDTWLLFHSYAFDFSVWEMWGALLYGGTLIIPSFLQTRSPESLFSVLKEVTIFNQTPSAFYQFMEYLITSGLSPHPALRAVIFGGEALDFNKLKIWFEHFKKQEIQMINMYGITETTVHVTYKEIQEKDIIQAKFSTIGKPIDDLSIWILNEHQNPLPPYIPGEICVSGGGVSRGYLYQDDLTSQRFIQIGDQTFYRSGDLGRYRDDGEIEYLGRIDTQVQLRGFRIELSEIQYCINQHPLVKDSIICIKRFNDNDFLVAYIVWKEENPLNVLREWVKQYLPHYMIPHYFMTIPGIPLTVNGKIDYAQLPSVMKDEVESVTSKTTSSENRIIKILNNLLGVETIDLNENFFDIGGDSILGIRFLSSLRDLGFSFELSDLYRYSIRELLEKFSLSSQSVQEKSYQPFSLVKEYRELFSSDIKDAYPTTLIQRKLLGHYHSHPDHRSHSVLSYELSMPLVEGNWRFILKKMQEEHSCLKTQFGFDERFQMLSHRASIPLIIVKPFNGILNDWISKESKNPFYLSRASLLRFFIHSKNEREFTLTLSYSDLILDPNSAQKLIRMCIEEYIVLLDHAELERNSLKCLEFSQFVPQLLKEQTNEVLNSSCQSYPLHQESFELPTDLQSAIANKAADRNLKPSAFLLEVFKEFLDQYLPESSNPYVLEVFDSDLAVLGQRTIFSQSDIKTDNFIPSASAFHIIQKEEMQITPSVHIKPLIHMGFSMFDLEMQVLEREGEIVEIIFLNTLGLTDIVNLYLPILKKKMGLLTNETLFGNLDSHTINKRVIPYQPLKTIDVFLLNPLGRTGYAYKNLSDCLTDFANVYVLEPIDYLGETLHETVENLLKEVKLHSQVLSTVYIVGFSASGLTSSLLAHRLRDIEREVKLILIDSFPMMSDFLTTFPLSELAYRFFYNIWRNVDLMPPLTRDEFDQTFTSEIHNDTLIKILETYGFTGSKDEDFRQEFLRYGALLTFLKREKAPKIEVPSLVLLAKDMIARYPYFISNLSDYFGPTPSLCVYPYNHLELVFAPEPCKDIGHYIMATKTILI